jgi:hypothetical protein
VRSMVFAAAMAFGAALACQSAITPRGNEPFDFTTSAYAARHETVQFPAEENTAIYAAVLRFYRPAADQARWLDPILLPSAHPGDTTVVFDPLRAEALVRTLGTSFCILRDNHECGGKSSGGTFRVSPLYRIDMDHARVVVRFTSRNSYASDIQNSQAFLLLRKDGEWQIESRGPVGPARDTH